MIKGERVEDVNEIKDDDMEHDMSKPLCETLVRLISQYTPGKLLVLAGFFKTNNQPCRHTSNRHWDHQLEWKINLVLSSQRNCVLKSYPLLLSPRQEAMIS